MFSAIGERSIRRTKGLGIKKTYCFITATGAGAGGRAILRLPIKKLTRGLFRAL